MNKLDFLRFHILAKYKNLKEYSVVSFFGNVSFISSVKLTVEVEVEKSTVVVLFEQFTGFFFNLSEYSVFVNCKNTKTRINILSPGSDSK